MKKKRKKKEGKGGVKEKNARAAYEGERKDEQTEVQGKDKKWWVGRGGGGGGSSKDVVRMGEDEGMEQHIRRDGATEVGFLTDSWKGLCETGGSGNAGFSTTQMEKKSGFTRSVSGGEREIGFHTPARTFSELQMFEAQFKFFRSLTTHLSII